VAVSCSLVKSADSGVVSPVDANLNSSSDGKMVDSTKKRSDSSDGGMGGSDCSGSQLGGVLETALSDSGQGSEPDDGTIMAFQFHMPALLTGGLQKKLAGIVFMSLFSQQISVYLKNRSCSFTPI
jgi:hypothetical protein